METSSRSERSPRVLIAVCLLLLMSSCQREAEPKIASDLEPPLAWLTAIATDRDVHEPQWLLLAQGEPALLWREPASDGSDLFVARAAPDGSPAVTRVNDERGTVASYPLDELRAAVAKGPEAVIAVGWTDDRNQIRVALSRDGAKSFEPSIRVEQTDTEAYRSFPELAFDESGALHVAWIDSRFAPHMQEEPADLFYARIADRDVTEVNLTSAQEESICGCCRPAVSASRDAIRITFRNTTAAGYRDIFTISGSLDAGFSSPRAVGEPLWKLDGCPMAGPMVANDLVIWPDGSTGTKRLMLAGGTPSNDAPRPVFIEETTAWTPSGAPRPIAGLPGGGAPLLFPGQPAARIASFGADGWSLIADELPGWSTSALARDGSIVVVGAVSGSLHVSQAEISLRAGN